jgi:hypothetical protein
MAPLLECHYASKHHLLEFGFFLDSTYLGFFLGEKLAAVLIIPSSWGSQLDGEKPSTPCCIMGPLDGGLLGPKGECPGHLGQAHQPPKAQPASPRGKTCPPLLPLAAGPRAWRRGQDGRPASYIRQVWGAASPSPNPSCRPNCSPPDLSLATAHRRSPAVEILHHKHHAVVLLIQSISPPYLLYQGRRRYYCTVCVDLSEASPLTALDRIGSRGEDD